MEIFIAFLLGILASLASWYAISRGMRPSIGISEKISSRREGRPNVDVGTQSYRVKVMNLREFGRYSVDLSFSARLVFRKDHEQGNFGTVPIPLSATKRAVLHDNTILWLEPCKLPKRHRHLLSEASQESREEDDSMRHEIEELLVKLPDAVLIVTVFATDSFSGTRASFSRSYVAADIKNKYFRGGKDRVERMLRRGFTTGTHPDLDVISDEAASRRIDRQGRHN